MHEMLDVCTGHGHYLPAEGASASIGAISELSADVADVSRPSVCGILGFVYHGRVGENATQHMAGQLREVDLDPRAGGIVEVLWRAAVPHDDVVRVTRKEPAARGETAAEVRVSDFVLLLLRLAAPSGTQGLGGEEPPAAGLIVRAIRVRRVEELHEDKVEVGARIAAGDAFPGLDVDGNGSCNQIPELAATATAGLLDGVVKIDMVIVVIVRALDSGHAHALSVTSVENVMD